MKFTDAETNIFRGPEKNKINEPRHAKMGLRTCADSVAPDQPSLLRSLIWELHYPLFHWLIGGQCSSHIRRRSCASWSGATLSAYVRRPIFAWRGSNYLSCLYSYARRDLNFRYNLRYSAVFKIWFPIKKKLTSCLDLHHLTWRLRTVLWCS